MGPREQKEKRRWWGTRNSGVFRRRGYELFFFLFFSFSFYLFSHEKKQNPWMTMMMMQAPGKKCLVGKGVQGAEE